MYEFLNYFYESMYEFFNSFDGFDCINDEKVELIQFESFE